MGGNDGNNKFVKDMIGFKEMGDYYKKIIKDEQLEKIALRFGYEYDSYYTASERMFEENKIHGFTSGFSGTMGHIGHSY